MTEQQDYHDFEPDVRDIAQKLNAVDFSLNSLGRDTDQQRLSFKARQESVMDNHNPYRHEHTRHRGERAKPSRRPVPLLVRASAAVILCFTVIVLGAIPLMQTSAPGLASTVEPLVSATPPGESAGLINRPVSVTTDYYATWFEAQTALNFRYYVPTFLPHGYALAQVAPPTNIRGYVVSTYFERDKWQQRLGGGLSGETLDVDYLHIAQSKGRTASDAIWLWIPRPNTALLERPPASFTMTPLSDDHTSYTSTEIDGQNVLFFRKSAYNFTLTSRKLSEETLLDIALSLTPYNWTNGYAFPPDAPGTCPLPTDYLPTSASPADKWRPPLPTIEESGQYSPILRPFNDTSPGVDFVIPFSRRTPVLAANDGVVIFAGDTGLGHGRTVVIAHGDYLSLYAKLDVINVWCGQEVKAGSTIGEIGTHTDVRGTMLHFELMDAEGYRINPGEIITLQ